MCFSGMGPVHMNEVDCSGFEKSITECLFNKDALGCSHEEDAAVRCNVPAMGFQERVSLSFASNTTLLALCVCMDTKTCHIIFSTI